MTDENTKSDGDIKMEILCRQLKTFREQLSNANKNMIGSRLNIDMLEPTIKHINSRISELMKSGVKRFVVPDKEIETPAQQPAPTGVR